MVVEEIVTSLKNAVDHGDSIENAIQLAVSSGYGEKDVQEAAQFVSGGVAVNYFKPKPNEQLAMPAQKSLISRNPVAKPTVQSKPPIQTTPIQTTPIQQTGMPIQFQQQVQTQPITEQKTNIRQDNQAIKENISYGSVFTNSNSGSLYNELGQIKPRKESYAKEIMLLIMLFILIGILISSFVFKDKILAFFSTMTA